MPPLIIRPARICNIKADSPCPLAIESGRMTGRRTRECIGVMSSRPTHQCDTGGGRLWPRDILHSHTTTHGKRGPANDGWPTECTRRANGGEGDGERGGAGDGKRARFNTVCIVRCSVKGTFMQPISADPKSVVASAL